MNPNFRNFALWVIIFLLVLALVTLFQSPAQKTPSSDITFSQLLTEADAGHIRDVTIAGADISGHTRTGGRSSLTRRTIRVWSTTSIRRT